MMAEQPARPQPPQPPQPPDLDGIPALDAFVAEASAGALHSCDACACDDNERQAERQAELEAQSIARVLAAFYRALIEHKVPKDTAGPLTVEYLARFDPGCCGCGPEAGD